MVAKLCTGLFALLLLEAHAALGQTSVPSSDTAPPPPAAAPPRAAALDPALTAEAKLAFEEGLRSLRAEAWAPAEASFRRSLTLVPRESTRYDLAFVLFKQRRARESLRFIEELQRNADPEGDPRYRVYAEALLPHVLAELSTLRLFVDPAASDLRIDGEPVAQGGPERSVRLEPGSHRMEVSALGFVARRFDIATEPGEELERKVMLGVARPPSSPVAGLVPAADATKAATSAPQEPSALARFAHSSGPWVAIGVGGALLAGAALTGIMAKSEDDDFVAHCPTLRDCDPRLKDVLDRALRLGRMSDVLLVSGGVLVAGGATWRLLVPSVSRQAPGSAVMLTVEGAY